MASEILVDVRDVSPSQDFLKERTVRFILECIENGREDELPPTPIVRKDEEGQLLAIDGHNLLAVMGQLGRQTLVHIAESADDGLPPTSEANQARNDDLLEKYERSIEERGRVAVEGVTSFADLVAKYPDVFRGDERQ